MRGEMEKSERGVRIEESKEERKMEKRKRGMRIE